MKTNGSRERILLIADSTDDVRPLLAQAAPAAEVTIVPTVFDGLAELVARRYAAILTAAHPIERRPEAALRELRNSAGDETRLLLFGDPTLEPLSKKMLAFGADDYVITPTTSAELHELLATRRTAPPRPASDVQRAVEAPHGNAGSPPNTGTTPLASLPLADLVLDALDQHPGDAMGAAIRHINKLLPPTTRVAYVAKGATPPAAAASQLRVSAPVRVADATDAAGELHLLLPPTEPQPTALQFATHLSSLLAKVVTLQDRHANLQRLAITDDLTGLYNVRYFRHFLARILDLARQRRSAVALSIFDIDNFKHYNDQFGHSVGDEILKQTATLIKRCVREHDHVARIGGDEFAVVFWEKDAPRQPHHDNPGVPGRPPQTPEAILKRFQGMMASQDLTLLGAAGKGSLTISAGLAVFPWDAASAEDLINQADKRLMFGAKKSGKNSINLVGSHEQ